jgi:hypothetical protein
METSPDSHEHYHHNACELASWFRRPRLLYFAAVLWAGPSLPKRCPGGTVHHRRLLPNMFKNLNSTQWDEYRDTESS